MGAPTSSDSGADSTCSLLMLSMHQGFSSPMLESVLPDADPISWPYYIKSALINLDYANRQDDRVQFTSFSTPGKGMPEKVEHGGRGYTWYKLPLLRHIIAANATSEGQNPKCDWALWLDSDSFISAPDLDVLGTISQLPMVHQLFRNDNTRISEPVRMQDVAVVVAREYAVHNVITPCEECQFNAGVMLFNLRHSELDDLLKDWWNSPLTGLCDVSMMTEQLLDQTCFDALVRLNTTTRQRYSPLVAEIDYLAINTPVGRIVRHDWEGKNFPPEEQFRYNDQIAAIGLLNEQSGASDLFASWKKFHNEVYPADLANIASDVPEI